MNPKSRRYDRRDVLKSGMVAGLATASAGLVSSAEDGAAKDAPAKTTKLKPLDVVRVGYVGVGHQGSSMIGNVAPGVNGGQARTSR